MSENQLTERVTTEPCILGEGPTWDHRNNTLYWVDILDRKVFMYDSIGKRIRYICLPVTPGCLALTSDRDTILMAYENRYGTLDLKTGIMQDWGCPKEESIGNRFNDGKCSDRGDFWFGSMNKSENKASGNLYRLDKNGYLELMASHITTSNGLDWDADHTHLYHIDTMTMEIACFDYNATEGSLSNRCTAIDFSNEKGRPDGMCIDSENNVWIAHWEGNMISKWSSVTRKCMERIVLPAKHVTSCCFGGEHMSTLFITTAKCGLREEEKAIFPLSGHLFALETKTRGKESGIYQVKYNKLIRKII